MIRSYPERNPFPHQGTLSIEAARVAGEPGGETQTLPTLVLDPVRRLQELAARYISSFTPSGGKSGVPVNLTGGHGSGKTHTILYVINQIATKELRPAESVLEPFVVYAKAEDPDFLKVYSQIIRQVPLELLADLSLRLLGVVAGEKFGQLLADPKVTQRAVELLRADPQQVNRLFDRYLVGQDTVRKELAKEIYSASGEVREFELAYTYLLHPELGQSAHSWLLGERIDEAEMRKLGITRLLDTTDLARRSLLLLATLFGRVGRPCVLFIDQYEKLVVTRDPDLVERNVGLLRDLVDVLPGKGILFAIAGNEQAWSALTVDLRQRFAGNVVRFPVLTLEEAKRIVNLYLTAGTQHILQVWDGMGEKLMLEMGGHALPIRDLAVSADEKLAVTASEDTSLKLWDLRQGKELRSLHGHEGPVNGVAMTPDGRTVVSASDDGTLRVWDLQTGKERLPPLRGHTHWVNAVAVTADSRYAVSGSTDTTARLWDLATGRELQAFSGHLDTIWSVAVTPDGRSLLTASADGQLGVWDLSTGKRMLSLLGPSKSVYQVRVSPDSRFAVSASDDAIVRLWDLENGQSVGTLAGHTAPVRALALSADGRWAVSAAINRKIIGWDLQKREKRFALEGTYRNSAALSFTPISGWLLVSGLVTYSELTADEGLFPLTGEAIHEMLCYGAGNIRRLLQICHQVFNRAFPDRRVIDAALVEATLKDGSPFYFNRQTVQSQVEILLGHRGVTFQRDYAVNNIPVDLAVLAPDGSPRMLINISEALFKHDETTLALRSLNLARTVQTLELNAQVLLVVLGYISPEVTPRLTEFVHNFIVYDPESFTERFAEVLDRLPPPSEDSSRTQKVLKTLEVGYEELRRRLEELASVSKVEVAGLQSSVTQYVEQQAQQKFEARRAEARQAWAQERRKIEEHIRQVRKDQRKNELDELERLRERAELSRRERKSGMAILVGLVGLVGLMVAFWNLSFKFFSPTISYILMLYAVGCALAAAATYLGEMGVSPFRTSPVMRELAGPVQSLEELDRLARSPEIKSRLGTRTLLEHLNPHYRYAGAITADPDISPGLLIDAILAERSAIVRRAFVQQIIKYPDPSFLNRAIPRLGNAPADAAYLVEAAALRSELDPNVLRNLPASLTTLAVLAGADPYDLRGESKFIEKLPLPSERDSLVLQMLTVSRLHSETVDITIYVLDEAFRFGLDRYSNPPLASVPEPRLRAAVAELSPLEGGGLGTFDGLRNIDRIDQLYLFFRQVLFYLEQDVLAGPEGGTLAK